MNRSRLALHGPRPSVSRTLCAARVSSAAWQSISKALSVAMRSKTCWASVGAARSIALSATVRPVIRKPMGRGSCFRAAADVQNSSFQAGAGELEFCTSAAARKQDPRLIGFLMTGLTVADRAIDLAAPTLAQQVLLRMATESAFEILCQAAEETRAAHNVRLTDGRGPWSASLERFIADHVAEYDLVVTHNYVFRPPVVAVEAAKTQGVPSILIPHAHLDDDFYHFPDVLESARKASLVLAAPRLACDFLAGKGVNVRYLPAGCDILEDFCPQDVEAFRKVFGGARPFILVLGRKAGAKGYQKIIAAVEELNHDGVNLHVVLIGPD